MTEVSTELTEWLALQRIRAGRISKLVEGLYVDYGRPIPGYVSDALQRAEADGFTVLTGDPIGYGWRMSLSDAGAARFHVLWAARRATLTAPPAKFLRTPTGVWPVLNQGDL
ncbi:MAG: hypothetical protein ACRDSP_05660 [Pseudonocardiaceae bacterium]